MKRTLILALLGLVARGSVVAQRDPRPAAEISTAGAWLSMPSSWLSQHPDSVYWIVSWSQPGHEIAWRMGDEGIAITVPDSVVRRAVFGEWGRSAQQRFYRTAGGVVLQDDPEPADVAVKGNTVRIRVHPGPTLESLLRLHPDSVRVDRGYLHPHGATWLQAVYH
jgi:hypothetical protein